MEKVYPNVQSMLGDQAVDAFIVCVPNALHAPQTITALKAGVAVMVEKPMALNSIEAEKMLETSLTAKTPLMVAHMWRFNEEVNWLKTQADSGKLGRIIRTKGYSVHTHWGPSGWFTQKKLAGGGAMADMGVHALDTTRYLLGDPKPVRVFASIGTHYIEADVDDTGVIMVEWDNGVISYLESGWWQPHVDGPEACTQLYGTKGFGMTFPTYLELPSVEAQKVDRVDGGFVFPRPDGSLQPMYERQMQYFVECVKTGDTPVPGGAEGLVNMKLVDAAYLSAQTRKSVDLT